METFKEDLLKIYRNERGILLVMIINFLLALGLFIFSVINLNPNSAVVKVGYGDIGGYRDGGWTNMLMYPMLAVLFGILHNLLALRIFHKRGAGMTKFFLITTAMLILGTFVVLVRLLGES